MEFEVEEVKLLWVESMVGKVVVWVEVVEVWLWWVDMVVELEVEIVEVEMGL